MKLICKEFIELKQDVPMVETTKEGLLRGGFVSLNIPAAEAEDINTNLNLITCTCNCNKNEKKCLVTTETTETTEETTVEPTAMGNTFSSMLF